MKLILNYSKEQIEEKVNQLLTDIQRPYIENIPFEIEFKTNIEANAINRIVENGWEIVVYVQEDQFRFREEHSLLDIVFDDDLGEFVSYQDMSSGRPVPLVPTLNDNDKYELIIVSE